MTVVTTVEAEERRQKRLLITLFSVFFLGLAFLIYDYFRIVNVHTLPEDTNSYATVLDRWKTEGFVKSLDVSSAVLVVNESKWGNRARSEKVGIVTQLARYCAEKKDSNAWVLRVVSEGNGLVLAEMGNAGMKFN